PRRFQPLGGVAGRHPDVRHHQVGCGLADHREQPRAVAGLPHHLEAGALEQAGQALPEQDVVLAQNHPRPGHGGVVRGGTGPGLAWRCSSWLALSASLGRAAIMGCEAAGAHPAQAVAHECGPREKRLPGVCPVTEWPGRAVARCGVRWQSRCMAAASRRPSRATSRLRGRLRAVASSPRKRLGVEIVLALVVGIAAFALAAVVGAAARSHVPAVVLGLLLLLAVLAIARFAGVLYALPVGVVTVLAFDWYFLPPLRQ